MNSHTSCHGIKLNEVESRMEASRGWRESAGERGGVDLRAQNSDKRNKFFFLMFIFISLKGRERMGEQAIDFLFIGSSYTCLT